MSTAYYAENTHLKSIIVCVMFYFGCLVLPQVPSIMSRWGYKFSDEIYTKLEKTTWNYCYIISLL